ncbi:MAG: hypothetical protein ACTSV0_11565 [Candidatus Freyarchaeota archaeon]
MRHSLHFRLKDREIVLPYPDEPSKLKRNAEKERNKENKGKINAVEINLNMWVWKPVASYLWNLWKDILKGYKLNFKKFEKLFSACTRSLRHWSEEKLSWEEVVRHLEEIMQVYFFSISGMSSIEFEL